MRYLYIDIDTLRPDHLGCYGYRRNTSPNIDRIAAEGVRFDNCYVSDSPCLPSRAALHSGRFGIHNGVINHGGTAADMFLEGPERSFQMGRERRHWAHVMTEVGIHTVSISPFAERHSAWWFYAGWREMVNTGGCGSERADEVIPHALDWLDRKGKTDDWFLHVNVWDPHTPYRAPEEYGDPFKDDPLPDWITEEKIAEDCKGYGPHSAMDEPPVDREKFPRVPEAIRTMDDYRRWLDGYDTGIKYADDHVGTLLDKLGELGVLEDTVVIVSSDHGENQGELNVYGDHQVGDHITNRVPMIVRWPGLPGARVDAALHYQFDVAATFLELVGARVPAEWDGVSFAEAFRKGSEQGRDYLVIGNGAWSCTRSVRWGDWLMMRAYHDGFKQLEDRMLFNLKDDPHELTNLAGQHPEKVGEAMVMLDEWYAEMMSTSPSQVDPLWNVMAEGGPFHTRTFLEPYAKRLRETGRAHHAEYLEKKHEERNWR